MSRDGNDYDGGCCYSAYLGGDNDAECNVPYNDLLLGCSVYASWNWSSQSKSIKSPKITLLVCT